MALPYDAILSRKLQELESRLSQTYHSLPFVDGPAGLETDETGALAIATVSPSRDDIIRRFEFLKSLLAAEMESHPENKPEHLYHIAERLAYLEDGYLKWAEFGKPPAVETMNTMSVCSCTYSCFQEGEDEDDFMEVPNLELPPAETERPEQMVPREVEEEARAGEEKSATHGNKIWTVNLQKKVWAVGVSALLAAAAIALAVTSSWQGEKNFLVPT